MLILSYCLINIFTGLTFVIVNPSTIRQWLPYSRAFVVWFPLTCISSRRESSVHARSFKSHSHLFLISCFRVRAHSLFGLRQDNSVVVSVKVG